MFNAEQIRALLTAREFIPFRIHMSDGEHYDITSHDHAMVTRNAVEVAVEPDEKGIAQNIVRCALIHITRIEELQPAK